jgi:hypothetical protein
MHWLAWSPGSGHSILIGKDRVLGIGLSAILSEELIQAINRKGVYYLYHATCEPRAGMVCSNWLTREELDLIGPLYAE